LPPSKRRRQESAQQLPQPPPPPSPGQRLPPAARLLGQVTARLPRSVIESVIKPYLRPHCREVTDGGQRCARAFTYRAISDLETRTPTGDPISCVDYCRRNCPVWLVSMLRHLPSRVIYYRPSSAPATLLATTGPGGPPIRTERPIWKFFIRMVGQGQSVVATLESRFTSAEGAVAMDTHWSVHASTNDDNASAASSVPVGDPRVLVDAFCRVLMQPGRVRIDVRITADGPADTEGKRILFRGMQVGVAEAANYRLPSWDFIPIFFDTPGRTWFRPPAQWLNLGEHEFVTEVTLP
jgi:hypothetical protein